MVADELHLNKPDDDDEDASQEQQSQSAQAAWPAFEGKSGEGEAVAYPGEGRKYVAYTIKLPAEQLAALQSIWLELKRLYGTHSPDKSGMIQQAIAGWLRRWDSADRQQLLSELLEIREETRRRQYKKGR